MASFLVTNSILSIQKSLDQVIQKGQGVSEEVLRLNPSEEEWSIMQILCHLAEAVPYWLDEIELLLRIPGMFGDKAFKREAGLEAVRKVKVDER